MKLSDLNPRLYDTVADGHVEFDCPMGHAHRLCVRIGADTVQRWLARGEYPETLTLEPSILAHSGAPHDAALSDGLHKAEYDAASVCGWHGFVRDGGIITC